MFSNSQTSFSSQGTPGSGTGNVNSSSRSSAPTRQGSPQTYHPHLSTYGYTNQGNSYPHPQEYGGMYPAMDHAMAWSAYSGFYRGYEMATATTAFADTVVWPHSAAHHPFGSVSGHHDGVDPLDPLQLTSSSSAAIENFGSSLQHPGGDLLSNSRETESPGTNSIKLFCCNLSLDFDEPIMSL